MNEVALRQESGRRPLLASLAGLSLLLTAFAPPRDDPSLVPSAERIRRHTDFLGADALEGRAAGSPGAERAAAYIAGEVERAGLRPLGRDGSFFQPVPLHGTFPEATNELFVVSDCGSGPLRLGEDFLLYSGGVQALIPKAVPLVFAGYGVVAPEFGHDDYAGLDVDGKVVVALSGEPLSDDPERFAGAQPTVYGTAEAKQRTALSRGARGSILLPSALGRQRSWDDLRQEFAFEHVSLAYALPRHMSALLSRQAAERLFCGASRDLAEVHRLEREGGVGGFPLPTRIWFRGEFRERDFVSTNVAAVLPGRDPELAGTSVIVSAHYDHLGVGPPVDGDAIYNGVVDNAIGVAAALEIARALAARAEPPRRSVAFLFTTAEEQGLLGSIYYIDHPLLPLHLTVANLNVDGLAHVARFEDVIGIGAELSTLGGTLERVARRRGLAVSKVPAVLARSDAYAFSDQAAFAEAGIPAILINEGFRWSGWFADEALSSFLEWMSTRYHQPSDDLGQALDFQASRQHAELLLGFVLEVADDPEAPRWLLGSPQEKAQIRTREDGR